MSLKYEPSSPLQVDALVAQMSFNLTPSESDNSDADKFTFG